LGIKKLDQTGLSNTNWSLNEYNFYFYLPIAVRVKKMTFVCTSGKAGMEIVGNNLIFP